MRPSAAFACITLTALGAAAACRTESGTRQAAPSADTAGAVAASGTAASGTAASAAWRAPADSEIPADSLGASIRRGLALVTHTTDSLPAYAPGRINCTNCHLQGGRSADGSPLTGAFVRYPRYLERAGAVVGITDRVNYCFTRSLAGTKLPADSREMQDIVAFLAFLSRGVPVGANPPGATGLPRMPDLVGDTTRGADVYKSTCVACHGPDGQGLPGFPALWGPKSYSIGASMAREERAASFIWHNMPLGKPKSLTEQQAFDVAAYINSKPRPDLPRKQDDWPYGGAPKDVPYDLKSGHRAYKPPPLLPRANAAGAIVPAPRRVAGR